MRRLIPSVLACGLVVGFLGVEARATSKSQRHDARRVEGRCVAVGVDVVEDEGDFDDPTTYCAEWRYALDTPGFHGMARRRSCFNERENAVKEADGPLGAAPCWYDPRDGRSLTMTPDASTFSGALSTLAGVAFVWAVPVLPFMWAWSAGSVALRNSRSSEDERFEREAARVFAEKHKILVSRGSVLRHRMREAPLSLWGLWFFTATMALCALFVIAPFLPSLWEGQPVRDAGVVGWVAAGIFWLLAVALGRLLLGHALARFAPVTVEVSDCVLSPGDRLDVALIPGGSKRVPPVHARLVRLESFVDDEGDRCTRRVTVCEGAAAPADLAGAAAHKDTVQLVSLRVPLDEVASGDHAYELEIEPVTRDWRTRSRRFGLVVLAPLPEAQRAEAPP